MVGPIRFAKETAKDGKHLGPAFLTRPLRALASGAAYWIQVRGVGNFYVRKQSSDLKVLRHVFRSKQYDVSHFPQNASIRTAYESALSAGKVPLIIDAGANNGASALWFSIQYPKAKVVAIEPDPKNCEVCRLNTRDRPAITLIEGAIGGSRGSVDIVDARAEAWAIQTSRSTSESGIPVWTVSDILAMAGPNCRLFVVKVDIEGFESDLFAENTQWLSDVTWMIIEPHDWMLPGRFSSLAMQRAIAAHRFELLLQGENIIYVRT